MNYTQLISLFFLTFFSLSAHNIPQLQQKNINVVAAAIEKKTMRDKFFLSVLTAFGHIHNIYILIALLTPSVEQSKNMCAECIKLAADSSQKKSFAARVGLGLTNGGYAIKNLFTTQQGWWSIGNFLLYYGSFFSASFITSRIADKLIHPDTLRWYIFSHVAYEATLEDMKEAIAELRHKSLSTEEVEYDRQLLRDSLIRLARYGELICAYMAYKIKHLEDSEQPLASKTAVFLFNYYNNWLVDMNAYCVSDDLDYDGIDKLIESYQKTVLCQLRHFYAIEGETKVDLRAVRDMA